MQVFDASTALYAWDNYPIEQFPSLWEWLGGEIHEGRLTIAQVAFEEVAHKAPDCATWLRDRGILVHPMTQAILDAALAFKNLLDIQGDAYGGGVGVNDLFIIATAHGSGAELVTEERRQPDLPAVRRNFKIPAVCNLPEVQVANLNFVEYFKRSGVRFG